MSLDQLKIHLSELGKMASSLAELRQEKAKFDAKLSADRDHSDEWKAKSRAAYDATWEKVYPPAQRAFIEEACRVEVIEHRLRDPLMALYSFAANGAKTPEADAAVKSEFRALLANIPLEGRRAWFEKLAAENDFGRLAVLVGLEPKLHEDALSLPIPGRDEALKLASEARVIVKESRRQELLSRFREIEEKSTPTQSESIELIRIGGELQRVQESQKTDRTLTEDERTRHQFLTTKAEPLTKGEEFELLNLAGRL